MTHREEKFQKLLMSCRFIIWERCFGYSPENLDVMKDLLQEVFFALWANLDSLDAEPTSFRARHWVNLITRRTLRDKHKKIKEFHTDHNCDSLDIASYDTQIEGDMLKDMMGYLTESERQLINDRMAGYTYEEIARKTGINAHALSERMRRTIQKLRIILKTRYNGKQD